MELGWDVEGTGSGVWSRSRLTKSGWRMGIVFSMFLICCEWLVKT